jgi:hypothetical protein
MARLTALLSRPVSQGVFGSRWSTSLRIGMDKYLRSK